MVLVWLALHLLAKRLTRLGSHFLKAPSTNWCETISKHLALAARYQ